MVVGPQFGGWRLQQRSGHATPGHGNDNTGSGLTMSRKSCSSDAILLDVLSSRSLQSWGRRGQKWRWVGGVLPEKADRQKTKGRQQKAPAKAVLSGIHFPLCCYRRGPSTPGPSRSPESRPPLPSRRHLCPCLGAVMPNLFPITRQHQHPPPPKKTTTTKPS